MTALLEARKLCTGYQNVEVVRNLDLDVSRGEVVVLLGPNGAGKSTTLRALSGVLPPFRGEVRWNGEPWTARTHRRAKSGLGFVPEERSVFSKLTGRENLRVGRGDLQLALELFPELEATLDRRGGVMSGGEQQMLALARALSRQPTMLLADELSLGLAPLIVTRLHAAVRKAADSGVGILLVEQHVRQVLRIADRAYVMRRGEIVLAGSADDISERLAEVESSYLSDDVSGSPASR